MNQIDKIFNAMVKAADSSNTEKPASADLQEYMKSLNPKEHEQAILIYGRQYKLWRDGEYLGIATWTQDENVGDSFQLDVVDESSGIVHEVFIADKWELVMK